jgi:hypothetical protein
MKVFLDFEASSLADRSHPVEVAWVFEEWRAESHLIRPAPDWTDWDGAAAAIHGIARDTLDRDGTPHDQVAARMVEVLDGHELFASAPSWDGKWLSVLLRAAGLPRRALRLRDTDEALRATATEILAPVLAPARLDTAVHAIVVAAKAAKDPRPAHRALPDAMAEYDCWRRARRAARSLAAEGAAS